MSRAFYSILDGFSLTNEDTSSASTQYFGYTRPGGSWVLMRIQNADSANTTYDFVVSASVPSSPFGNSDLASYDTAWTNRASPSKPYLRAGELQAL